MTLKKSSLEAIFNLAKGTEGRISLIEARVRDSFIKPLQELTQTYYDDREKIFKVFCLKKEDGTPDLLEGDKYQFKEKEKIEEMNKELITLSEEEVEFSVPNTIKPILEKSDYMPKIFESEIIDDFFSKLR